MWSSSGPCSAGLCRECWRSVGFNDCFMLNLAPASFTEQRLYIFISLNVPPKGARKKERKENPDHLVKKENQGE